MKRVISMLLFLLLTVCAAAGCQVETEEVQNTGATGYYHYYLSADETELLKESYTPENEAAQSMVQELLIALSDPEAGEGQMAVLPAAVSIEEYELGEDGVLTIDFNRAYNDMSKSREILVRAGVVKSFVQVPGIRAVLFLVNGDPLTDSRGEPLGEMNGNIFVSYPGEDMDAYCDETFVLYFADRAGEHLVQEERTLYYRRDLPKERVVLEQLSTGPMNRGCYPTVPENLLVRDIVISDRICYIDLDRSFLDYTAEGTVSGEVSIYSIVNSIIDACEVDKVQILIDGEAEGELLGGLESYRFYEKNESLVIETEEQES